MKQTLGLALALAILAPAGPTGKARAEEAPLAQAARLVAGSLPPQLVLAELALPDAAKRQTGTLSISWLAPPRRGTQSVRVVLPTGARVFARVRLAEKRRVLVAGRALVAGALVADGDLVIEERAGDDAAKEPPDPASLRGAEVRRDLAAGEAVVEDALVRAAPLAAGSVVRVRVERGGVVVAESGRLERAARPGDAAMARLPPDMRLVRGRLADGATLLVEEVRP